MMIYSYSMFKLVEINSHSLFSRWFSESGKLVQKLFGSVGLIFAVLPLEADLITQVTDMVDDEDTFVVLLIGTLPSIRPHCAELNASQTKWKA